MTHSERDQQLGLRERVAGESAHAEVRSRLSDYLDGTLPTPELDETRQHLDSCADCHAYWRTLLRLINTTGQLPRRTPSQETRDRILAEIDAVPARS